MSLLCLELSSDFQLRAKAKIITMAIRSSLLTLQNHFLLSPCSPGSSHTGFLLLFEHIRLLHWQFPLPGTFLLQTPAWLTPLLPSGHCSKFTSPRGPLNHFVSIPLILLYLAFYHGTYCLICYVIYLLCLFCRSHPPLLSISSPRAGTFVLFTLQPKPLKQWLTEYMPSNICEMDISLVSSTGNGI